jgi:outer membrane protein
MKNSVLWYLLLFMSFVFSEVKIGYVDSQQIMTQYEGFRLAQIELEKEQKRLEAEYNTMAQQLDSLYRSYEQQRLLMSDDRKKEKENELVAKERELQEFGMKKLGPQNSELVQIQNQLMQPILKVFSDACNKVGADQGYDFIFDAGTGGLLYSLESHNITDEVIEEMNKISTNSSNSN